MDPRLDRIWPAALAAVAGSALVGLMPLSARTGASASAGGRRLYPRRVAVAPRGGDSSATAKRRPAVNAQRLCLPSERR